MKTHSYAATVKWTGNTGQGTETYRGYDRAHEILAADKPMIHGSADPAFRGDPTRWNPEELLVASVAACHKLWYLHLCTTSGVTVVEYEDNATGVMIENPDGSGQFQSVTLNPQVVISTDSDPETARMLHGKVGALCFIARSVNCPIHHHPTIKQV